MLDDPGSLLVTFAAGLLGTGLALAIGGWWLGRRARRLRDELQVEIETATELAAARIGHEVEARVRKGVRDGIRDGVTELPSRAVIEGTTRVAARTGVDLISHGLGTLLGGKAGRRQP